MAAFDWKKLDSLDKVVAVTAAIAVVALFLPWLGVSEGGFSASVSGFSAGLGLLGALLIIAAGVYLVMLRSGSSLPKVRYGPGVMVLGLSAIGTLLVIVKWATVPKVSNAGIDYSYGPRVGMWLTILVGVVQVMGALRLFRRSGEAAPWASK